MGTATTPQIQRIWATARERGMDEEDLRALVEQVTGSPKISTLSKVDAIKVIDAMNGKLPPSNRASQAQVYKISELAGALGWIDNPKRLQGFLRKYGGVENPNWLTKGQAWKVIEGMKSMLARQNQEKKQKNSQEK